MMQLVGQLEAAQQQLQQQLRAPGGAGDPAELDQLRRQLADEAEDNDELSKQIVALDSDHQKPSRRRIVSSARRTSGYSSSMPRCATLMQIECAHCMHDCDWFASTTAAAERGRAGGEI